MVVSAALLYWSLKDVHWTEVREYLKSARTWPIVVGALLATLTFPLRIPRWQFLLRREDGTRLPGLPLWHAIAMGFMSNNVLPLRMGEVVRIFAASKLTHIRFTAVLASLAVERLFDALTVVALLALGLLFAGLPSDAAVGGMQVARVVTIVALLAVGGLVAATVVVAFPRASEAVVRKVVPFPKLAEKLVSLIEGIRQGMSALQSPARVLGVVFWSLVIWLTSALSFYIAFAAFDIEVNFAGALVMQGLIMFGIAVPSTPGYLGVFEAPIIALLALYGVPASLAATYAFLYHFATFIPITLFGAWSVLRTNLGLREVQAEAAEASEAKEAPA